MSMRKLAFVAASIALTAAAQAQVVCHSENDGNNYDDFASITGAWFGIEFVAPASFSVQRIEIFTGEVSASSQLDIWANNATLGQPSATLGGGTFTIQTPDGWQGANMFTPIPLSSGTTYWVVWHPVAGAQPSLDQPGAVNGQNTCVSVNSGQSWNGPFASMDRQWKFRLYGDCCASYVAYCTAGTTSNGCSATLSATGAPDANAGSGFTVVANGVEGQKQGILFYGITGAVAQPWGTGSSFLCVKTPTQRTGVQNSNGTLGACDGALALDWNAFIASSPSALGNPFAGGEQVWIQAWFRDPPSPKTTSLSNALQFVVCP
jgi:hypothetical protein